MNIGLVAPVKPFIRTWWIIWHRCLTSTICAFHLGFGLVAPGEGRAWSITSGGNGLGEQDRGLLKCRIAQLSGT